MDGAIENPFESDVKVQNITLRLGPKPFEQLTSFEKSVGLPRAKAIGLLLNTAHALFNSDTASVGKAAEYVKHLKADVAKKG